MRWKGRWHAQGNTFEEQNILTEFIIKTRNSEEENETHDKVTSFTKI